MGLVSFLRSQKIRISKQHGFSLVELMVVVAIIGILASIAVPNYQRFQRKSRQSGAKTLLSGVFTAQRTFNTEWGYGSTCLQQTGYSQEGEADYYVGWESQSTSTTDVNVGNIDTNVKRIQVSSPNTGRYNGPLAIASCPTSINGTTQITGLGGLTANALADGAFFGQSGNCLCPNGGTPVAATQTACAAPATSGCNDGASTPTNEPGQWNVVNGIIEPGQGTDTMNNITFVAGAVGNIGAGLDAWTITHQKILTNTQNGL